MLRRASGAPAASGAQRRGRRALNSLAWVSFQGAEMIELFEVVSGFSGASIRNTPPHVRWEGGTTRH